MQFFTSEKNRTSSSHGKKTKQYDKHVKLKHEFYAQKIIEIARTKFHMSHK